MLGKTADNGERVLQDTQPSPTSADHGLGASNFATIMDVPQPEVPQARPVMSGHAVGPLALASGALPGLTGSEDDSAELRCASFGARAGAAVIDFVILQAASMILDSMFLGLLLGNLSTTTILAATMGPLLVSGVFALFYSVWLESSSWQATPGKKIMGLKVVDLHGQRIGFGSASCRNLAKGLSMLTFGMGYLMPLWSTRRQTLHDKVTGCLVIRSA